MPVIAHWKQKRQEVKKTFKNMHARILETWLSFGVFDFVFTDTGGIFLLEKKEDGVFSYSPLVKQNVPVVSYEVAKVLSTKEPTQLSLVEKFALRFLPEPFQRSLFEQRESLQLAGITSVSAADGIVSMKNPSLLSILLQIHKLHDILGDGNCGIYAILQGANPSVFSRLGLTLIGDLDYNFSIPKGSSREDTLQWQNAKKLREFLFSEGNPHREMATGLSDPMLQARELENSDLSHIAQRLRQDILLFTEDMQKIELFCADGSEQVLGNEDSLPDLNTCICLYHNDNHFQAIVPKTK